MKKELTNFQKEFPSLKIEEKEYQFVYSEQKSEKKTIFYVSGLEGNPSLLLYFENKEELAQLSTFLRKKLFIFKDFLAIKYDTTIEVLLTTISFKTSNRHFDKRDEENYSIINIGLAYYKNELNLALEVGESNKILPQFANFIRGAGRYSRRKPIVLKIDNYIKPTSEGIENDTRNIINSALFDIEYNYDIALETINIEGLLRRSMRSKRKHIDLPDKKINLIYKKYIPELIQYFHIAEKVDFIPFKYICYYHIIEYFSDKSAYHLVSNEIKYLLLKPDFHLKTDYYVTTAINLIRKENEKNTGDKIKIERVLKQHINREEIKTSLSEIELLEYFSKEVTLDCNKPLKLPAVNFDNDGNFYNELTKRIYSVRCSIVHSNPDFDENKGIPFSPTPKNIEKLRTEIELIMEIARKIIINTKE